MKKILPALTAALLLLSCRNEPQNQFVETDLMAYGIPVSIMAPDSAEVKSRDLAGIFRDVTVRGEDNYYLQILASSAETSDLSKVKASQMADVKGNRYFSRIVREEEAGFVYETAIDSNNINYGFRYILLQGDQEIVFQTGMIGTFTLDEVEKMYVAVKQ